MPSGNQPAFWQGIENNVASSMDLPNIGNKRTVGTTLRRATTEPITLEDVHLGPFEIRLDWDGLAEGSCT
jgi:hypothetical protein